MRHQYGNVNVGGSGNRDWFYDIFEKMYCYRHPANNKTSDNQRHCFCYVNLGFVSIHIH